MTNITAGFTGGWGVDAGFTKKSAFTQIELSVPPKMMFYRNSESRTTYPVILKLRISTPKLVPKGFPASRINFRRVDPYELPRALRIIIVG